MPENIGKFPVRIVRSGRTDNAVSVRYEGSVFFTKLTCIPFLNVNFDFRETYAAFNLIRVETIEGSAVAVEDYVAFNQVVYFEPHEVEKKVS